jgi:hypothetical protein
MIKRKINLKVTNYHTPEKYMRRQQLTDGLFNSSSLLIQSDINSISERPIDWAERQGKVYYPEPT